MVSALASAVCGCAWQEGPGASSGQGDLIVEQMPILYQRGGTYCSMRSRARVVVRNKTQMALVPVADVPVDFGEQMVLFVTLGRVYSDRFAVRIERVWRQGRLIRVALTETYPAPGEAGPPQPCSPYYLVVVPRSDLNVEGFETEFPAESSLGGTRRW